MRAIIFILGILLTTIVSAKDLGTLGKTFPIAEMDFLEYIQQKLADMNKNGQLQSLQTEFKKRVKEHLYRPTPTYLPKAKNDKTWVFEPSIRVSHDVLDHKGRVLVKQGTFINPLDRVQLTSTLLFFDGDDKEQLDWVTQEALKYPKVKLILTSGSVKSTVTKLKQAVYFDLNGFLITKFHIRHLPAKVAQHEYHLVVSEVAL